MKRFHLISLFVCLSCIILAACGGTSSHKAATPTGPQKVKITIGDFYIHSAETTFTAGTQYQFVVTNLGTHYHNFLIMHPTKTTMLSVSDVYNQALLTQDNLAPNETETVPFVFDHTAPTGMLEFSCHYGGHYEAGMHQAIVVKAAPGASVSPYPNDGLPPSVPTGPCDSAITTTFGNGAYNPANISLKSGDTLTILNTGSSPYTPIQPIPSRFIAGGPDNAKYITFPFPGQYELTSQETPNAKAEISVSDTDGATCGMNPTTTVEFTANYADPKNRYSFTPTQVRIKKDQSIRLANLIDQDLSFISTPDANFGTISISKYWDEDLKFSTEGTYTISSVEFPTKKFTVIVQGT